jgi:HEAT repeat protein
MEGWNLKVTDRKQLVDRIIEEKGEDAIPILVKLLDDEDTDVAEICLEALMGMGKAGRKALVEKLKQIKAENRKGDVTALFIIDRLAESGNRKLVQLFYSFLKLYSDERSQVIIYEALAKLGEGEKVVDPLMFMLDDAKNSEFIELLIMALSNTGTRKALERLSKLYHDESIDKSTRSFILEGIHNLIANNPNFSEILRETSKGKEILDKLYLWQQKNEQN